MNNDNKEKKEIDENHLSLISKFEEINDRYERTKKEYSELREEINKLSEKDKNIKSQIAAIEYEIMKKRTPINYHEGGGYNNHMDF